MRLIGAVRVRITGEMKRELAVIQKSDGISESDAIRAALQNFIRTRRRKLGLNHPKNKDR